ncbi:hypothetical protein QQ045_006662 [Rhodiola kirilowii]
MKPKPNINFDTLRVWLTTNPNQPLLSASTSSMVKMKTLNVKRSPLLDAPEVTSKPKMKLRSPSTRRVPPRLHPAEPPTCPVSSDEEDSATEETPSQPDVAVEFCNTERARVILGAMKPIRKMKKLDALAKTPPPPVQVLQTPPRDEGGEKRKVRGVVNGSNVAYYKHTPNKGQPIKVEFLPDGTGPASQKVCSLLVHEIGSVVRDKVPMLAPSFMKLEEQDRHIVYDYLNPNFVIDPKDDQLWNFISRRAIERYRDWKADCKLFYKEHRPNVNPHEFLDRRDKWEWLKSHFDEPKNQERGEAMSKVRTKSERLNHRSGKVPFYMRDVELKVLGEKAHIVATYAKVFSADPAGAALADLNGGDESDEGSVLDEQEPLPVDTQLRIISEVLGQRRVTYVSGAGRSFKKPPLPRGCPRTSDLKEQL